jgi:hypothetical protein
MWLTRQPNPRSQPQVFFLRIMAASTQKNPATAGGERRKKNVSEQATAEEAPQTSLFPENQEFQRSTRNLERQRSTKN